MNTQPENREPEPHLTTPPEGDQTTHSRGRWLAVFIAAVLIGYALGSIWLWRQTSLLSAMQSNTHAQQLNVIDLQLQASQYLMTQPDNQRQYLQAFRDGIKQIWSAHWENEQGRFASLQTDPATGITTYYQHSPSSLSSRLRTLVESTDQPGFAPTAQTVKTLDAAATDLQQIAHRLAVSSQRYQRRSVLLSLALATLLALLLAAYYLWWLRALHASLLSKDKELGDARARLLSLSQTDPLTDLANRRAITRFLSDVRSNSQPSDEFLALAVLDIDHFSHINDAFGYYAGDAVLQTVGARIQIELRDDDKLGRLDADHFAIVLRHLASPRDAEKIIDRIQKTVSQPVDYKQSPLAVSCTVGASVQQMDSLDLAELFKLADQALLRAKQNRRGSVLLLSNQAQAAISRQREIVSRMKYHPPEELFNLVYQPIVSLRTNAIAGAECLLRWREQAPADLHPEEFVPVLEMFGEINRTGDWILEQGLVDLSQWQQQHPQSSLFLSINVSALQLDSSDFADTVIEQVKAHGLKPTDIALELTESTAMKYQGSGQRQLTLLRNRGFGISLDDFGTGYSSLQHLKNMPVSTVKIDKSFVAEMLTDKRDAAIVESTIHISTATGLSVVAEGIENQQQAKKLTELGCTFGQGYFFSPPVSAERFASMLGVRLQPNNRSTG